MEDWIVKNVGRPSRVILHATNAISLNTSIPKTSFPGKYGIYAIYLRETIVWWA